MSSTPLTEWAEESLPRSIHKAITDALQRKPQGLEEYKQSLASTWPAWLPQKNQELLAFMLWHGIVQVAELK